MLKNKPILFAILASFSLSSLSSSTVREDRYWRDKYSNYFDQYTGETIYLMTVPDIEERVEIIREVLSLCEKYADEAFIQDIAQFTQGFKILQIRAFIVDLADVSEGSNLDREMYIDEVKRARRYLGDRHTTQLQETSYATSTDISDSAQQESIQENKPKYPLLEDVYHKEKKQYFASAAKQLKEGQFREEFRQGMLLYGKPGVGKGEIVEAMKNESDCEIIRVKASELVERYQGTGSSAIKEVFNKAKMIQSNKGVIVFIDELQALAPVTNNANPDYGHKYEGKDFENTLSQIWTEHDEYSRKHKNILIVATTNNFELIDKRIQERFKCIEFPYPDAAGVAEILKNNVQHSNVPMTESDFKKYEKRLNGMSGREINTFISDAKDYIEQGMSTKDALEQSYNDIFKSIKDAKPKGPSTMDTIKDYSIKGAAIVATGTLGYLAWTVVGPVLVAKTSVLFAKLGITSTVVKTAVGAAAVKTIAEKTLPEPMAKRVEEVLGTPPAA